MIFLASGCWNRRELNTLGVVGSVLYDVNKNKQIVATSELLCSASSGSTSGSASGGGKGSDASSPKRSTILVQGIGSSEPEALRNSSYSFSRKLYYPHTKVRFFSETFANTQLYKTLDFFLRDHELRQTCLMVVVKGEHPERIFTAAIDFNGSLGDYIYNLSQSQPASTSGSVFVDALEFMRHYHEDGLSPVAGVVEIINNPVSSILAGQDSQGNTAENYSVKYAGLAAFNENEIAGYLDENETRSFNMITGGCKSAYITIPYTAGNIVLEVINSSSDIKTELSNRHSTVFVSVSFNLVVTQVGNTMDISDPGVISQIKGKCQAMIKSQLETVIKKVQNEIKTDIFGFGFNTHIQHPKEFAAVKSNWDDIFRKADVFVDVKASISRTGEQERTFRLTESH